MSNPEEIDLLKPESRWLANKHPDSLARAYALARQFPGSFAFGSSVRVTLLESGEEKKDEYHATKRVQAYRLAYHKLFMEALEKVIDHHEVGEVVMRALYAYEPITPDDRSNLSQAPQLQLFTALDRNYLLYTPGYVPQDETETELMPTNDARVLIEDVELTPGLL